MATNDAVRIDARGMRCPWPVLRAARAMRDHDTVEILADDPIAGRELAALASQHNWRFEPQGDMLFHLSRAAEQPLLPES